MVGLLSQMEGTDHSPVSVVDDSTVSVVDHSTVSVVDHSTVSGVERSAAASEQTEGSRTDTKSAEETLPEMCQETEQTKDSNEAETVKSDDNTKLDNVNEEEEVQVKELKSILKRRGQYTMRKVKVDFDLIPKRIPFDETKDYTIEIQIVDKEPVKIKSWAALFAAKKAEAEAEEAAAAEAEAAMKKAEEHQKREALKRANKAKLLKKEADKKNDDEEKLVLEKEKTEESTEGAKAEQLEEQQTPSIVEECRVRMIENIAQEKYEAEILSDASSQLNSEVEVSASEISYSEVVLTDSNVYETNLATENEIEAQKKFSAEEELELHNATSDEVSEQISQKVLGVIDEDHSLCKDLTESEDRSVVSTDESKSEGGVGSVDVSEQLSTEMRDGGDGTPLFQEKSLVSADESVGGVSSTEIVLLEKLQLPEEVLTTAVTIVEDILAQTPAIVKALSIDEEGGTDCLSASSDTAGLRDLYNEDKTESNVEELPREDQMDSLSEELLNLSTSDSTTDGSNHSTEPSSNIFEKVQQDTTSPPEVNNFENKIKNAISLPAELKAKVNNTVVSKKLNESLKKASPEIIQSAVRVLVEIEKVTLAVVKNLEPLVP